LALDELEKLKEEFSRLTQKERTAIARAMLEGAVKYRRRKNKAAM
jgi:hypothetical protein